MGRQQHRIGLQPCKFLFQQFCWLEFYRPFADEWILSWIPGQLVSRLSNLQLLLEEGFDQRQRAFRVDAALFHPTALSLRQRTVDSPDPEAVVCSSLWYYIRILQRQLTRRSDRMCDSGLETVRWQVVSHPGQLT